MHDTKIYAYEFIPSHKKETRRSLLKNIQFLYQGAIENRRLREVTV